MRRAAIPLIVCLAAACSGRATVHIGHKDFVEQEVLAEIIAEVIGGKLDAHTTVENCGDTFGCQQALRSGEIDLLVEYTGTGILYSGADLDDKESSLDALRRAYAPAGVAWLDPLGFDNGYRLVVDRSVAASHSLETIADLAKLDGGNVRVACPPTYVRRPRDGLAALLERHGLVLEGEPLLAASPAKRIEALTQHRVDVAVVYATDGALSGAGVVALEDSLGFFPRYDAVLLARTEVLDSVDGLRAALAPLAGAIDNKAMRALNHGVSVEGWSAQVLARRFVRDRGLGGAHGATAHTPTLVIAADARASAFVDRTIRAVRAVFSEYPVEVIDASDPIVAVVKGDARLALIGAEQFFVGRAGRLHRIESVEAVAVVGSRALHAFRKRGQSAPGLSGKVGVERAGPSSIAAAVLATAGKRPALVASRHQLLEKLRAGELDAVLAVAPKGDPTIAGELTGDLELFSVNLENRRRSLPYLRPSRIAAETYPGQDAPIETLAAQVVIAGPSGLGAPGGAPGGPASAMTEAAPLSIEEAEALARATGVPESPDSVLPSKRTRWREGRAAAKPSKASPVLDTIINILTLVFLGWFLLLLSRGSREWPEEPIDYPSLDPR
jgi:glycine betaine/choline ABC-type transport system substrate-binding protein